MLDGIDGKLARYFDQTSKFGAVMDMVADRTACSFLYMLLAIMYGDAGVYKQNYSYLSHIFFTCFVLDFGSHWL